MSTSDYNNDLFSASLESIETSKRIEKFRRFKEDFQRECEITLSNAQEWIKAELPMITEYVDHNAVRDELRQSKISKRRRYLLTALLFEQNLRNSIDNNDATSAAFMAMHMISNMWQAKIELHGLEPIKQATASNKNTAVDTHTEASEKILTTLIKKSERLKTESQIQKKSNLTTQPNSNKDEPIKKSAPAKNKKADAWAEELEKEKKRKLLALAESNKTKKKSNIKSKKKSKLQAGKMLSKVKTKFPPLVRKNKRYLDNEVEQQNKATENNYDEELFDDPNRSSIMVNPGFSESIDDSLIKARAEIFKDPNESGVTIHKFLKDRDHEKQEPGSNTIIMKLASSSAKRPGANLSLPEQCQQAVNLISQQFPGYDLIAIRNMAAKEVGVSPQYIENLNIRPEKTG